MTIDELNALTTLTAADEVPVWDSEESGEPTKKITASNLAASVKSLAGLTNTTEMNTAIQQSTARVNYSLTNVVSQSTPQYELYKIGNRVYLNVHSLWKASVAKDTWETWATIPADLVKDIGSANPSTVASLVNGNNGNVVGTTMIEINKSNHDLRVKSPVALSAGPAAGYGLVFVIDWYNV